MSSRDFTTLSQDCCKDRSSEPNMMFSALEWDCTGTTQLRHSVASSMILLWSVGLAAEYGAACSTEYDSVVTTRHYLEKEQTIIGHQVKNNMGNEFACFYLTKASPVSNNPSMSSLRKPNPVP